MITRSRRYIFLVMISGLFAFLVWTGLLGVSRVQAQPLQAQALPEWYWTVVFTDPVTIQISDLSGAIVGEGTHLGKVRCNGSNCAQKTSLDFTPYLATAYNIDYKFKDRLALDLEEERVVLAGEGSITSDHMSEKFSFTAVFQNNRDGTVSVRYEASRPDASFALTSRGSFEISSR